MFGSNDDKKTPAAAGEKKGLFGWLRKKPQETVVEQPQAELGQGQPNHQQQGDQAEGKLALDGPHPVTPVKR